MTISSFFERVSCTLLCVFLGYACMFYDGCLCATVIRFRLTYLHP